VFGRGGAVASKQATEWSAEANKAGRVKGMARAGRSSVITSV
jgi:hypothetical protein